MNLEPLRGRTVAIVGYGTMGRAHALNLRRSGIDVVVGSRPGSASGDRAREEGLEVLDPAAAVARLSVAETTERLEGYLPDPLPSAPGQPVSEGS